MEVTHGGKRGGWKVEEEGRKGGGLGRERQEDGSEGQVSRKGGGVKEKEEGGSVAAHRSPSLPPFLPPRPPRPPHPLAALSFCLTPCGVPV
eukprot:3805666-Rhodomonas_salina.2